MVLPLWRSLHSLNLMLPKEDRKAMLLRLYNEDTPLMDHSKDRFLLNGRAGTKEEEDDDNIKEEEEGDDNIKKEEDIIKEEGEGEMAAVKDGDVETVGNGTLDVDMDVDVKGEMQDDAVADGVKAEVVEDDGGVE